MIKRLLKRITAWANDEEMLTISQSAKLIEENLERHVEIIELCLLRRRENLIVLFLREGLSVKEVLDRLLLIPHCSCSSRLIDIEIAQQHTTVH